MNKCVVLMPLSKYKNKELFRYVETLELADPKLFEDAVITENLCICTLNKSETNKYSWLDLVLKSVDQRYIEYYKWNVKHNKGLFMKQSRYKQVSYFDNFNGDTKCSWNNWVSFVPSWNARNFFNFYEIKPFITLSYNDWKELLSTSNLVSDEIDYLMNKLLTFSGVCV